VGERGEARQGLAHQAQGAHAQALGDAAPGGGHRMAQQAGLGQTCDQRAAGGADLGVLAQIGKRARGEMLDLGRERAVALVEEGPREEGAIGHGAQLPSNAGGRFSTNARYARRKSSVCMHRAWACASASIAASMLMSHSWSSI